MIFIFMRNLIRRILREQSENVPNSKMMKLIEKIGIVSAVKTIGMDDILDILDTEPINLIKYYLVDKELSTKNLGIPGYIGGYDFNFVVKDIDYTDDTWEIYVKILDGMVTVDGDVRDLWDSDLWEEDWWWEIQNEITEIIDEYLKPLIPNNIGIQITHNLE